MTGRAALRGPDVEPGWSPIARRPISRSWQSLVGALADLVLILVVPAANKPLGDELADMGCRCEPIAPGYARIVGPTYTTLLVTIDDVCEVEKDEFLRLFSARGHEARAARKAGRRVGDEDARADRGDITEVRRPANLPRRATGPWVIR